MKQNILKLPIAVQSTIEVNRDWIPSTCFTLIRQRLLLNVSINYLISSEAFIQFLASKDTLTDTEQDLPDEWEIATRGHVLAGNDPWDELYEQIRNVQEFVSITFGDRPDKFIPMTQEELIRLYDDWAKHNHLEDADIDDDQNEDEDEPLSAKEKEADDNKRNWLVMLLKPWKPKPTDKHRMGRVKRFTLLERNRIINSGVVDLDELQESYEEGDYGRLKDGGMFEFKVACFLRDHGVIGYKDVGKKSGVK